MLIARDSERNEKWIFDDVEPVFSVIETQTRTPANVVAALEACRNVWIGLLRWRHSLLHRINYFILSQRQDDFLKLLLLLWMRAWTCFGLFVCLLACKTDWDKFRMSSSVFGFRVFLVFWSNNFLAICINDPQREILSHTLSHTHLSVSVCIFDRAKPPQFAESETISWMKIRWRSIYQNVRFHFNFTFDAEHIPRWRRRCDVVVVDETIYMRFESEYVFTFHSDKRQS